MNAQEIAEALRAEVTCGPRIHVVMAAGDYAAVIVERIVHAASHRDNVSRGVLDAVQAAIDDGDVFDDEQIVSLGQDLPVLRAKPPWK